MFYIIEGFLDIILPPDDKSQTPRAEVRSPESGASGRTSRQSTTQSKPNVNAGGPHPEAVRGTHLFTVKPGGIAGYLCS
jgi:lysophospholipid hydrolase